MPATRGMPCTLGLSLLNYHHCLPSLSTIIACHHCLPSLSSITAYHHCLPSLSTIFAYLNELSWGVAQERQVVEGVMQHGRPPGGPRMLQGPLTLLYWPATCIEMFTHAFTHSLFISSFNYLFDCSHSSKIHVSSPWVSYAQS